MSVQPLVSLLVAVRNEASHIERCLRSVLNQDYPAEYLEVLVLDGDSTDGSRQIAERVLSGAKNARVLANPGITQARGWNLGIASAHGDLIGIVSGHVELAPDYVSCAVELQQRTGADMVGGPARAVSSGRIGAAIAVAQTTRFGVGGARFRYSTREEEVDTVFMGVCPRRVYETIGAFDPEMDRNQDDEFSYRLRGKGGRIVCSPTIRSSYFNRSNLRFLWRQYFAYGFWKVRVMQKHPDQMRLSHYIPALFVAAVAVFGLLGLTPIGAWPLALLLGAYVAASVAAALLEAGRAWRVMPLLPVTFAVLHVAYGAGFLRGILYWPRRPLRLAPELIHPSR
jgi:succinoglycan biosynthesis protein ExoA